MSQPDNNPPVFEPPAAFAKRVGLPENKIRQYVKEGKLPHVITGKTHVKIHVDAALGALRLMAENNAAAVAATMPAPIPRTALPAREKSEKKFRGRVPDAIRLGRKPQG